jgi:hypothetical protein
VHGKRLRWVSWAGRLALRFIDNPLSEWVDEVRLENTLRHGSPHRLNPGVLLEPRQATWDDSKRRKYADGKPAICCSATSDFPVVRALLHNGRPELKDIPLCLAKRVDNHGRAHWFTTKEALAALGGARGFVSVVENRISDLDEGVYDKERDEYRIYSERRPLAQISVGVEDLPSFLNVISVEDIPKLVFMRDYPNPRAWGDETGVSVQRVGDLWPLDHFPR